MNWLARLKKTQMPPNMDATNATKPGFVGFVGFVASIAAPIQKTKVLLPAANDPAPEPPTDPNAWRELAAAYHLHHFACPACIAAGRGAVYGLRCGVGAALWNDYQNT